MAAKGLVVRILVLVLLRTKVLTTKNQANLGCQTTRTLAKFSHRSTLLLLQLVVAFGLGVISSSGVVVETGSSVSNR